MSKCHDYPLKQDDCALLFRLFFQCYAKSHNYIGQYDYCASSIEKYWIKSLLFKQQKKSLSGKTKMILTKCGMRNSLHNFTWKNMNSFLCDEEKFVHSTRASYSWSRVFCFQGDNSSSHTSRGDTFPWFGRNKIGVKNLSLHLNKILSGHQSSQWFLHEQELVYWASIMKLYPCETLAPSSSTEDTKWLWGYFSQ